MEQQELEAKCSETGEPFPIELSIADDNIGEILKAYANGAQPEKLTGINGYCPFHGKMESIVIDAPPRKAVQEELILYDLRKKGVGVRGVIRNLLIPFSIGLEGTVQEEFSPTGLSGFAPQTDYSFTIQKDEDTGFFRVGNIRKTSEIGGM